jgi:hypothetical protein
MIWFDPMAPSEWQLNQLRCIREADRLSPRDRQLLDCAAGTGEIYRRPDRDALQQQDSGY